MRIIAPLFLLVLPIWQSVQALEEYLDYPPLSLNMLYNTETRSQIEYHCEIDRSNEKVMHCTFNQVLIGKPGVNMHIKEGLKTLELLQAKADSGKNIIPNDLKKRLEVSKEECISKVISDVDKDIDYLEKDAAKVTSLVKSLCNSKNHKDFLNILRFSLDIEKRTCEINQHSYSQMFVYSKDDEGTITWMVQQESPSQECGEIRLDRFVRNKGRGKFQYHTGNSILKNDKALYFSDDKKCSSWIESERVYRSVLGGDNKIQGCDYFEFGRGFIPMDISKPYD